MSEILIDNLGFKYVELPPKGAILVTYNSEFFFLKEGKRKFVRANIEMVKGDMYIYSEYSGRYYLRELQLYHNPLEFESMRILLSLGRIHIKYDKDSANLIKRQYLNQPLTYNSWVRTNNLILELELLDSDDRHSEGVKSKIKRCEAEILQLSNNLRK